MKAPDLHAWLGFCSQEWGHKAPGLPGLLEERQANSQAPGAQAKLSDYQIFA